MAKSVGNLNTRVVHQPEPVWANSTEQHFASLLDAYGIDWLHEPDLFPIGFDAGGQAVEFFAPDFYLPATDEYIELTVLRQCLCTKKNRKLRRLRELYPDIKCRIIYRRDYEHLALKYQWEADPEFPQLGIPVRVPGPPQIRVAG